MSLCKKAILAGSYIALSTISSCSSPEMVFDLEKSYQKVSQEKKTKKYHLDNLRREKIDLDIYFRTNKNLQEKYKALIKQSKEIKEKIATYKKEIQIHQSSQERDAQLQDLIPNAQREYNKIRSELKLLEDKIKSILEKK